jgi:hypothetical protein
MATVQGHRAQVGASALMPSATAGINTEVAPACMIPLMWARPVSLKEAHQKSPSTRQNSQLVAARLAEHHLFFSFVQDWGRHTCLVVAGPHAPDMH